MKGLVVIGVFALAALSGAQSDHAGSYDTELAPASSPLSDGSSSVGEGTPFRLVSRDGGKVAFSGNGTGLSSDPNSDKWIESISALSKLVAGGPITVPNRRAINTPVAEVGFPVGKLGSRATAMPALLITSVLGLAAFALLSKRRK